MKNEIYLRRSKKVIVVQEQHHLPDTYMATAAKNIEALGFIFSSELIAALRTLSVASFILWYEAISTSLKKLVGAHVDYKPMYPNFPQQVMEASEAELYLRALFHYITGELPAMTPEQRAERRNEGKLEVIDLGDEDDFRQIIRRLIAANTSISSTDKADLIYAIEQEENVELLLPPVIPYKEQLVLVAATLIASEKADMTFMQRYMRTATDVLRLAVALSDGDVSLATNTPFRKFKRAERRLLLGLLEQCPELTEDMLRHSTRWIRLGEILHPSEYKSRFVRTHEAFAVLRNKTYYETFNRNLERALRSNDIKLAMEYLLQRPGEFARRLDHLLRLEHALELDENESASVAAQFASIAHHVATPVLLQVMTHFKHRQQAGELRLFFPKGNVAKTFAIDDTRPPVSAHACGEIAASCEATLLTRFAKLPELGSVYLDAGLQRYIVPFSQRSASKALRTLVRGSKLEMSELGMSEGDTIRFFLWWKEGAATGRADIDLSAVLYDGDWNYMEHISYTNLRSAQYKAAHSGDIVSAPSGACEFIDIDIPSVLNYGGRYIVATLHSFTGQAYCELPECFAGWMMRKQPQSGEVFEPATVVNRIDLASNTQISIPVVLDLQQRTVIWCDLALTRNPNYYNNVEGHQTGISLLGKAMTTMEKTNLYDLFRLHALARGQLVEQEDEAETVFSPQRGITPWDIETIIASFLAS